MNQALNYLVDKEGAVAASSNLDEIKVTNTAAIRAAQAIRLRVKYLELLRAALLSDELVRNVDVYKEYRVRAVQIFFNSLMNPNKEIHNAARVALKLINEQQVKLFIFVELFHLLF